ncbi:MAG: hypothetical protein ABR543_01665 [Gemmatimonadaceae bacterium]
MSFVTVLRIVTEYLAIISAVASIATAVGVMIAGRQLALTKRQSTVQFEDQLSAQYRELIRRIPIAALLGEPLREAEHAESLAAFYHYIDLSNEQAFLHEHRRVSSITWQSWREGIKQNLALPAFEKAWEEVGRRAPNSFDELRRIVPPKKLYGPSDNSGSPGPVDDLRTSHLGMGR